MGRPPSNGGPAFRFNQVEVGEMEAILQAHNYSVPAREVLETLAQRFSASAERSGKVEVQIKQVWNWFQNRRYALRARAAKVPGPGEVNVSSMPRDDHSVARTMSQLPQPQTAPSAAARSTSQAPHPLPAPSTQNAGKNASDNSQMEFEAKSARDGAWYDVACFLSHRSLETVDPEVLVRFSGFGPEEDEWVNIRKHVRQRSLPCESSECVAVLPGDLILCFQEGKEQALYFDAHVLDAQRRRHDVRGCRCRFLVRYDHDQSEEIVPLRKVCRRPETDYRLQQLNAMSGNANPKKPGTNGNSLEVNAKSGTMRESKTEVHVNAGAPPNPVSAAPANFVAAPLANPVTASPANPVAASPANPVASPSATSVAAVPANPVAAVPANLVAVATTNPVAAPSATPVAAVPANLVAVATTNPVAAPSATTVAAVPANPVVVATTNPVAAVPAGLVAVATTNPVAATLENAVAAVSADRVAAAMTNPVPAALENAVAAVSADPGAAASADPVAAASANPIAAAMANPVAAAPANAVGAAAAANPIREIPAIPVGAAPAPVASECKLEQ